MNPQHDPRTPGMLEATASSLRVLAGQIEHGASLLAPPGKHEWAGSSSAAFGDAVHEVRRRVILASDLAAAAGRFASLAAGQE